MAYHYNQDFATDMKDEIARISPDIKTNFRRKVHGERISDLVFQTTANLKLPIHRIELYKVYLALAEQSFIKQILLVNDPDDRIFYYTASKKKLERWMKQNFNRFLIVRQKRK